MPAMAPSSYKLPIAERFVSINGEGLQAGKLSAFIRFAGCDLACSYCDTAWARDAEAATEHLRIKNIVAWAFEQSTACITLTGGEPLQQPLLLDLVKALLEHQGAYPRTIEVETSGARSVAKLIGLRKRAAAGATPWNRLSVTMDYKLPSSGMESKMVPERFGVLGAEDAVKFVCGSRDDLLAAKAVIDANGLTLRTNVLLSPVFGQLEPADIVDFMKENGMVRERLQLQLHKIIWPGQEKGV